MFTNKIFKNYFELCLEIYKLHMKKTGKKHKKPDIYSFFDYREYLSELFDYNKEINPVFSHRHIILRAGFKSPKTDAAVIHVNLLLVADTQ